MTHQELYFKIKTQLKQPEIDLNEIIPILEYMKAENPIRLQEFVRLLAKVKTDLAKAAMNDRQMTIKF